MGEAVIIGIRGAFVPHSRFDDQLGRRGEGFEEEPRQVAPASTIALPHHPVDFGHPDFVERLLPVALDLVGQSFALRLAKLPPARGWGQR